MQSDRREELIARFVESVDVLHRQVRIDRLNEWQQIDLTIPQVKTLFLLENSGALRMGSIAASLGIAVSATTTVVDRLVERGLVVRLSDPKDRRVVICDLTEQGQEAAANFWRIGRERVRAALEPMTTEQLDTLVPGLESLCRAARLAELSAAEAPPDR
ncbi:MAG: MarR family transcriptional regulator [bacterium]|nr:MarR family transcriptional regulator [bacterium]